MGKHRHEYTHTCSHTHQQFRVKQHPVLTSPRVPAHTWALMTTWQTSPRSPPPHTHSQSFKDTPKSFLQTLALRVYHHGHTSRPPTWTPAATASYTLVCVHTHITVTHTHSLSHALTQNSDVLTYGHHHTLRTVDLPHRYHCTSRAAPPTPQ